MGKDAEDLGGRSSSCQPRGDLSPATRRLGTLQQQQDQLPSSPTSQSSTRKASDPIGIYPEESIGIPVEGTVERFATNTASSPTKGNDGSAEKNNNISDIRLRIKQRRRKKYKQQKQCHSKTQKSVVDSDQSLVGVSNKITAAVPSREKTEEETKTDQRDDCHSDYSFKETEEEFFDAITFDNEKKARHDDDGTTNEYDVTSPVSTASSTQRFHPKLLSSPLLSSPVLSHKESNLSAFSLD